MLEHFRHLTSDMSFIPHGHCYLWNTPMVAIQAGSNLVIGLSYVAIASTLAYLVIKIKDLPFERMYLAFGIFIISCGITHFFDVWTVWSPDYWWDAGARIITAVASLGTALILPALVPKAIAFANAARAARDHGIKLETAYEELGAVFDKTKEVERLKSEFFANVSHELRTPLALILGPIEELLKAKDRDPEEERNLQVIRRNSRQLLKHVNDLLDISKLEARKMDPRKAQHDLASLTRLLGSHFDVIAADHQITLRLESPASLLAEFDSAMIERVILNVLSNAFKFAPDGGAVRLTLASEEGYAKLEIADSGRGVPAKFRRLIFERFSQVETGPTRSFGGTGLGLSIAKEFLELHEGTIEVGDAPEGGALFTIRFPLRTGQPLREGEPEALRLSSLELVHSIEEFRNWSQALAPDSSFEITRGNVLLVEDNAELNRFLVQILSRHFNVQSTTTGAEALRYLSENPPPDLVLTDVMMPEMSGDELVQTIRQNANWNNVSVVFLTAKAEDDFRIAMLRDGAQDYILKPFAGDEVVVRVANQIAMKRTRELLQAELNSQVQDLEVLAGQMTSQKRDLQDAVDRMKVARDEAARATQAKDNFLGMVSHEVRTPLTALHMQLEMFQRSFVGQLEPRQQQMLLRIFKSSGRSLEIIDTLLEYTRLQSGTVPTSFDDFSMEEVAEESVQLFLSQAEEKDVALEFIRPEEKLEPVKSDVKMVKIVLQNLIGNAVKYTDQGKVRVELAQREGRMQVRIVDTGPGIPDALHDKIFEPFEQVAPLERKTKAGFGLGLSIARQAAVIIGGGITLDSSLGRGSQFDFEIPISPS